MTFGDSEDLKGSLYKRLKEVRRQDMSLIPDRLIGWKFKHFRSVREYDRFAEDIYRALAVNRLMLGDYIRDPEQLPAWAKVSNVERDIQVSSEGIGDKHQNEPTALNRHGGYKGKQVGFPDDTYDIPGNRGNGICSTPKVSKESPDVSMCSRIEAEDEARYEAYGIPVQYRRRSEITNSVNKPMLSSTIGGNDHGQSHNPGLLSAPNIGGQGTGMSMMPQSIMSVIPPGHLLDMFTPFSGQESKYIEWRSTTKALLRSVDSPELQAILLKKLLQRDEEALVSHIFHSDPSAVDDIWYILDQNFGGSNEQAEIYMTKLQNWARNGAQCNDYKSLLHLYNLVKENYYGIVRLGAEHIGMAEAIGYSITPLLFGKSQREVNRLRYEGKSQFTMKKVLDIIEKHLQDLKRTERDADKLASNDPEELQRTYDERDLPFLRKGLYMDSYQGRGGYKGRNYDPNYKFKRDQDYRYHRDNYKDRRYDRSSSKERYRDSKYSRDDRSSKYDRDDRYRDGKYSGDRSRERYRDKSRDTYRDKSRDYYRDASNDRYRNSKYRDSSRDRYRDYKKYDRDASVDRHRDSKYDRGRSQERYRDSSRDRYREDSREKVGDRGRSPIRSSVFTTVIEPTGSSTRRGRDPTPRPSGRLSTGRSPSRQRRDRPINTFKCTLCQEDDHDVFDCRKYTSEQVYTICNEKRLCYTCYLTGHGSANCKSDRHCKDSRCKTDIKHHKMLCDKLSRAL